MKHALPLLALALAAPACDILGDDDEDDVEMVPALLTLRNAPELDGDHVYEAWLVDEGEPTSLGRMDEQGELAVEVAIPLDEDGNREDLIADFFVSLEKRSVQTPEPSNTPLLAGQFALDRGTATTREDGALGVDVNNATVGFVLDTPTTASVSEDYHQGVWFELNVPELPEGWVYEGWVRFDDGTRQSTGRFSAPGPDEDGAGPAAGGNDGFDVPGQDFIDPPRSILGTTLAITVEPDPDNSSDPFFLEPFVLIGIQDVPPPEVTGLFNNGSSDLPAAELTLME